MTAIALLAGATDADQAVRRMLDAMGARGGDSAWVGACDRASPPGASLAVGRAAWEQALAPGPCHARTDRVTVVADATLYYVDDLARACTAGGAPPASRRAADLIAAAYLAFGDECASRLEGDFAFVLWDAARTRVVAARDFAGKRTLFHAFRDGRLAIASSADGVLAAPGMARDVDLATLASVASGLWTHTDETAWRGVRELRAGHRLVLEPMREPMITPSWHAPTSILGGRQPLEPAAEELRELLVRATEERLATSGPTAVSLSGGWDSTAVFASASEALARRGAAGRSVVPVSISYPEGDPGREDELIRDVVAHWGTASRFIDVDGIPMFLDAEARAARRELPMAHTYEEWNRALHRGARAEGAPVMLDGLGGDQLFQVSDIYLSDLFRRGRWVELARQARSKADGRSDLRSFYHWAVRPALPATLTGAIARLRRRPPPRDYLDRQPPFWVRQGFLEHHGVMARERAGRPRLPHRSAVLAESHAALRFAFYPRIVGMLAQLAIEEGVELRSPLLDERVVRFALRRPWSERADGRETKILLRRAMRGLLPPGVLAPRPHRTGVTSAYFLRQVRGPGRPLVERTFFLSDSRLASVGMVDPALLRRAWEHVLARDDDETAGRIFFTLQAELWLRAHERSP